MFVVVMQTMHIGAWMLLSFKSTNNRNCRRIPISISRSNLPGRLKAGSMLSGRFVAAITRTRSPLFISSINFSSVATIRRDNPSPPSFRAGAMASNSSIKTLMTTELVISGILKGIGVAMGAVAVAAGAAAVKLGKEVISAYADYEQLVGGVDTLFGEASQSVQGYAENAFKTADQEFGGADIVCPGAGVYEPHWTNFWQPPGSAALQGKAQA